MNTSAQQQITHLLLYPTINEIVYNRPKLTKHKPVTTPTKQMTTSTIIISIALLLLIGTMYVIGRYADINSRQSTELKTLRWEANRHDDADRDSNALYIIKRPDPDPFDLTDSAATGWGVYRVTTHGGRNFTSCIKLFTDEDDSFNLREAEELRDKLNAQ